MKSEIHARESASFWRALEVVPGLNAVPAVWREKMGAQFELFASFFLQARPELARSIPCRVCGCAHEVTIDAQGAIIGVCRCEPWNCAHLALTTSDIQILELNWPKFGRAVASAFGLEARTTDFGLYYTWQIGSWDRGVPVVLTLQHEPPDLYDVLFALTARLRQRLLVLSPTASNLNAASLELLARDGGTFVPLHEHLLLAEDGLRSCADPGELFTTVNNASAQGAVQRQDKAHVSGLRHAASGSRVRRPMRYALRKGHGVWKLVFDGQEADLKHEQGIFYVAWLLSNAPSRPIHVLDLAAKVPGHDCKFGLTELIDPASGQATPLDKHARLQQRNVGLDDAPAMRALLRKQSELQSILDDENESEPAKAEALRELEEIMEFQRTYGGRSRDSAQKAAEAIRKAIRRFHARLLRAVDAAGKPHPVLRAFAEHLEKYLLTPSARFGRRRAGRRSAGLAGCLTYEAPPGVRWNE